eukprot:2689188-Karenia_brevis.AAC.1
MAMSTFETANHASPVLFDTVASKDCDSLADYIAESCNSIGWVGVATAVAKPSPVLFDLTAADVADDM